MWSHLLSELMEPLVWALVLLWCMLCVCDPIVGEGVVVDEQQACQKSSAESAFSVVKLVVVVVAFVGVGKLSSGDVGFVGKLMLCSWRPLWLLSVALVVGTARRE